MAAAQYTAPVWDEETTRRWQSPAPALDEALHAPEATPAAPRPRPRRPAAAGDPTAPVLTRWRRLAAPTIVLVALLAVLALGGDWIRLRIDDIRYGQPRTTHLTAFVGHADGDGVPTHFIAVNMNRRITIIELPGSDPTKARVITGPYLVGKDEDLTPATMRVLDANADGHGDLLVRVKNEEVVYINDKGEFRLMTRGERPTVEKTLGGGK